MSHYTHHTNVTLYTPSQCHIIHTTRMSHYTHHLNVTLYTSMNVTLYTPSQCHIIHTTWMSHFTHRTNVTLYTPQECHIIHTISMSHYTHHLNVTLHIGRTDGHTPIQLWPQWVLELERFEAFGGEGYQTPQQTCYQVHVCHLINVLCCLENATVSCRLCRLASTGALPWDPTGDFCRPDWLCPLYL